MIKKPVISATEAAKTITAGQTVMVGGFLGCGSPPKLLEALSRIDTRDLTLVCNDCGCYSPGKIEANGVAVNVIAKQFRRVIVSHIGLNVEIQRQMNEGETEVVLVPQGTLAEQIRAAGCGLGGILTPTGLGTEVSDGKQTIEVDGRAYLLETALSGDVALLRASKADEVGNLYFSQSARNFNPLMAMACTSVIVEVDEIVPVGAIDPEVVMTPSIFVDYLVCEN